MSNREAKVRTFVNSLFCPAKRRRRTLREPVRYSEQLEIRSLMSGSALISLSKGTLNITGTEGTDSTEVRQDQKQIVVTVETDGTQVEERFSASKVQRIHFDGRERDDRFSNATKLPTKAFGGAGNDTLLGGSGSNELRGEGGDDVLTGDVKADSLDGGDGDDFLLGGSGNDTLSGGEGHDFLSGEDGNDNAKGGTGDDSVLGGNGNDRINGDQGDDLLSGESGRDTLNGGVGDDVLYGGSDNDSITSDSGFDTIFGVTGKDKLSYGWSGVFDQDGANEFSQDGLSERDLRPLIDAAFERWSDAGIELVRKSVDVRVADLPGTTLAWTVGRSNGTPTVYIDKDAAGHGWYIDSTPRSDDEFEELADGLLSALTEDARSQIDLLSVLAHEVGHVAGYEHSQDAGVLMLRIAAGVRVVPFNGEAFVSSRSNGQPFLEEMTTYQSQFNPAELSGKLHENGLSVDFAEFLATSLLVKQLQSGQSILNPSGSGSTAALQQLMPLGPTGLFSQEGRLSTLNSGVPNGDFLNLVLAQAIPMAQINPVSAATYLGNMIQNGNDLLLQVGGYEHIRKLSPTADVARRIVNDPVISLQSGQAVYNATVDYIQDNHIANGTMYVDYEGINRDFGIDDPNLTLLSTISGAARPAGTSSGSPFIDSLGAPIGTYPWERTTWAGVAGVGPQYQTTPTTWNSWDSTSTNWSNGVSWGGGWGTTSYAQPQTVWTPSGYDYSNNWNSWGGTGNTWGSNSYGYGNSYGQSQTYWTPTGYGITNTGLIVPGFTGPYFSW